VQLKAAPFHPASEHEITLPRPAAPARRAGAVILAGSSTAIVGVLLPWVVLVAFGISLARLGLGAAGSLAGLALLSAGIATLVLLRRPATAAVGIVLILMAVTQLGLAIWADASVVHAIAQTDTHDVMLNTIGTGSNLNVLGAAVSLVGGYLAWRTRVSARHEAITSDGAVDSR
jgi:hypothetical protein